ncbi:hypothetical protein Pmani_036376 [Petrolisthes manimaculis]|uniref:Uncharacterized protein n=1 Tax=Petrolisthes manimaculis TaxID=1843537 RepID=A0AAE1NKA4_9EUCA|nr:hypothetical protein Pmani_036376 [Petrolisthes manimaculis]
MTNPDSLPSGLQCDFERPGECDWEWQEEIPSDIPFRLMTGRRLENIISLQMPGERLSGVLTDSKNNSDGSSRQGRAGTGAGKGRVEEGRVKKSREGQGQGEEEQGGQGQGEEEQGGQGQGEEKQGGQGRVKEVRDRGRVKESRGRNITGRQRKGKQV